METEIAIVISGVVSGVVRLIKAFGVSRMAGLMASVLMSAVAVVLYAYSQVPVYDRSMVWPYFSAFIMVATSAVGILEASTTVVTTVQNRNNP